MLNLAKLKLFPFFTKDVFIPINEDQNYNIIFLSENDDFVSAYPLLRIRRQYAKKVTVVPFKVPRLIITMKDLMRYKVVGLLPANIKEQENVFIDTTPFFTLLDNTYGKGSYRRPMILSKAVSYLRQSKHIGENKKNILIYHINLSKPISDVFINRRSMILAMIAKLGDGKFPFDSVVLAIQADGMKFTSIFNKEMKSFNFGKIVSIFKKIKPVEDVTKQIVTSTEPVKVEPENEERKSILKTIDNYQKDKITK